MQILARLKHDAACGTALARWLRTRVLHLHWLRQQGRQHRDGTAVYTLGAQRSAPGGVPWQPRADDLWLVGHLGRRASAARPGSVARGTTRVEERWTFDVARAERELDAARTTLASAGVTARDASDGRVALLALSGAARVPGASEGESIEGARERSVSDEASDDELRPMSGFSRAVDTRSREQRMADAADQVVPALALSPEARAGARADPSESPVGPGGAARAPSRFSPRRLRVPASETGRPLVQCQSGGTVCGGCGERMSRGLWISTGLDYYTHNSIRCYELCEARLAREASGVEAGDVAVAGDEARLPGDTDVVASASAASSTAGGRCRSELYVPA